MGRPGPVLGKEDVAGGNADEPDEELSSSEVEMPNTVADIKKLLETRDAPCRGQVTAANITFRGIATVVYTFAMKGAMALVCPYLGRRTTQDGHSEPSGAIWWSLPDVARFPGDLEGRPTRFRPLRLPFDRQPATAGAPHPPPDDLMSNQQADFQMDANHSRPRASPARSLFSTSCSARRRKPSYKWQARTPVSETNAAGPLFDLIEEWGRPVPMLAPRGWIFRQPTPERRRSFEAAIFLVLHVEKRSTAPVTAIIGYDLAFYERYDFLHPHDPDGPRSWIEGKPEAIRKTAFQNGTLQGAYLMMAARSLGLDCGPMAGFDNAGVEKTFFPDGQIKANFLCNLGYGDESSLFPRLPRFAFEDVCEIV